MSDPRDIDPKGLKFFNEIFSGGVVNINDAAASKWRKKGLCVQDTFTNMVATMKDPGKVPLKPINDLMSLVWGLVGKKAIPTGMTGHPMIKTLAFYAEASGGNMAVAILVPEEWPQMVREDPCMQMGALVFVGSQAKDHWNLKVVEQIVKNPKQVMIDTPEVTMGSPGENPVVIRARSYEAEFLHWVRRNEPKFAFNEYQQKVLEKFPNGLKSLPPELAYVGRPGP